MRFFHFCDCLELLPVHIRYDSVHLIYYTPPYYSKRDYNLLFKTPIGHVSILPKVLPKVLQKRAAGWLLRPLSRF